MNTSYDIMNPKKDKALRFTTMIHYLCYLALTHLKVLPVYTRFILNPIRAYYQGWTETYFLV